MTYGHFNTPERAVTGRFPHTTQPEATEVWKVFPEKGGISVLNLHIFQPAQIAQLVQVEEHHVRVPAVQVPQEQTLEQEKEAVEQKIHMTSN